VRGVTFSPVWGIPLKVFTTRPLFKVRPSRVSHALKIDNFELKS
jgi:hypothetical protein